MNESTFVGLVLILLQTWALTYLDIYIYFYIYPNKSINFLFELNICNYLS
jgi:hypothetical protein